jgi:hypothetical protein
MSHSFGPDEKTDLAAAAMFWFTAIDQYVRQGIHPNRAASMAAAHGRQDADSTLYNRIRRAIRNANAAKLGTP